MVDDTRRFINQNSSESCIYNIKRAQLMERSIPKDLKETLIIVSTVAH
jgi:hypothetical protein